VTIGNREGNQMPSVRKHCEMSKQRTGHSFFKLHKWIDRYQDSLGVDHRQKRHAFTRFDESRIIDFWDFEMDFELGDKAVVEWLFHNAIDNLETAFKKSKRCYGNKRYNYIKIGFSESGEIYLDCQRLREKTLETIFLAKNKKKSS